jgi:hypothetical protein
MAMHHHRAQYNELRRKNKNVLVADVYGAEHLLRLFGTTDTHMILLV